MGVRSVLDSAVRKMMGVYRERLRSRIIFAVVKPSMPGIFTSMRMAAKSSSSTHRNASSPEEAATRRAPSVARISCIAMMLARSSSTMRMDACRESSIVSFGEHQERIAPEPACRPVGVHGVERMARPAQELCLPAHVRQVRAPGRIAVVDQPVTGVLEAREGRLLREVMDVPDAAPLVDERRAAGDLERGELERNVEELVASLRAQLAQEAEVILDVLEHVDRHHEVEPGALFLDDVGEPVLEFLVGLLRADRICDRRDFVAE